MKIAAVVVQRPVFVVMVILVPIVFGAMAYARIAIEQYPSVELPLVTVIASYPGADPASMETKVARPIEDDVDLARSAADDLDVADALDPAQARLDDIVG